MLYRQCDDMLEQALDLAAVQSEVLTYNSTYVMNL